MSKKNIFSTFFKSDVGGRIVMVLAIVAALVLAISLSGHKVEPRAEVSQQNSQIAVKPQDRPLTPAEKKVQKSSSEYPVTYGIVVGAASVLLIVEVGTLIELRKKQ